MLHAVPNLILTILSEEVLLLQFYERGETVILEIYNDDIVGLERNLEIIM